MNRKPWTLQLMGAAFAFLLSVSAVGNLATGFDLSIAVPEMLFLWCAVFSLISAIAFRFKYGEAILLGLSILAAPLFWNNGLLWDQLQSLAHTITSHYYIVYRWPILGTRLTEDVSLPLIVLSAWAAFSVSWTFCRRQSVMGIIPPVIFPLVLCLVTTDKLPDEVFLYLLILGMGLLLLTDWTRRNHQDQGLRLTLRMAVPVAAALALLFIANPRQSYVNQASSYQQDIAAWFQDIVHTNGVSGTSQTLNLKFVGPKGRDARTVMRVNSPLDGTLYLRGRDYDVYSGTGWESSSNRREEFPSGGTSAGQLSITTYGIRDVMYVPYYTAQPVMMTDGALDNDDRLRRYSYDLSLSAYSSDNSIDSHYTELPADTRRWAVSLDVIQAAAFLPYEDRIRLIEDYVRSAAVYDLSTSRMSPAYDDFAQWFLEESDTGYCVHFATAATVLLRAAGIPARYVEGYMVSTQAGEDVDVKGRNAHAWVEYYNYGVWRILEVTPADLQEEDEPVRDTRPEETEPAATEEPTAADPTAPAPETQPLDQEERPGANPGQTAKKPFKLPDWFKTAFWIMLAAAVAPVQSRIRIARKRRLWNRGNPNEKAVARWKQTARLARLLREPFPEELETLAGKALFSQHRIRDDELQRFDDYWEDLLAAVRGKPWYQRILLRWIFAIGR